MWLLAQAFNRILGNLNFAQIYAKAAINYARVMRHAAVSLHVKA